jgi:membrane-bound lytic murein transglycosylase B
MSRPLFLLTFLAAFFMSTNSAFAASDIPPRYLKSYQQTGRYYDVPWQVLAGIGKVESDHGRKQGPVRRIPKAFSISGPMMISGWVAKDLGVDGNRDGRINMKTPEDSIIDRRALFGLRR